MNEQGRYWTITVGLYPGILFGYRAYQEENFTIYVIYLPFVDFALEIEH